MFCLCAPQLFVVCARAGALTSIWHARLCTCMQHVTLFVHCVGSLFGILSEKMRH